MSLMKKLTSAVVASSLVLGVAGVSFAAETNTGANRMAALGLLQGDENGDLMLDKTITRAEFVTVMVRAFGQDNLAKAMHGTSSNFSDVDANAWYSGYVAVGKALMMANGHEVGIGNNQFAPDQKLTAAEAVAFAMKFMGVKENTTLQWPNSFLVPAVEAGLITDADKAMIDATAGAATRGFSFQLLDGAFYNYDLGNGKTVYTTIHTTAPVVTLGAIAETTTDATITVTGSASGYESLWVDTAEGFVALDTTAGNFSVDLDLAMGLNEIAIVAVDLAGNVTTKTATVNRIAGEAAGITAEAITVAAGASVDLGAKVVDAAGAAIEGAAVTGESTLGTVEGGKFVAGEKAGTGIVTLKHGDITKEVAVTVTAGALAKVVPGVASAAPNTRVTFTAQDAHGNTVEGATFAVTAGSAFIDANTGSFIGFEAGTYTITATKGTASATASYGVFGAATKLGVEVGGKLVGNYDSISETGSYQTVKVYVQDANGNLRSDSTASVTLTGTGLTIIGDGTSSTAAAVKGVATFKVYAPAVLRGQVISLEATATGLTAGTGNIEIEAQVAQKVELKTTSDFVGVADATNLGYTVSVVDQNGVAMRSGAWDVKVSLTGPAVLTGGTKTEDTFTTIAGTGAYSGNITSKQFTTGTVTITATVDGLATSTATKSVNAVFVGAPAKVSTTTSADSYTVQASVADRLAKAVTFTASLQDAQGAKIADANALTSITLDLSHLTAAQRSALVIWNPAGAGSEISPTDGKYTIPQVGSTNAYTFKVFTDDKLTGDFNFKLTATHGSTALTAAEKTISIKAGAPANVSLSNDNDRYLAVANPKTSLTAQLTDALGNPAAKADVEITFGAYTSFGGTTTTADITFDGTATTKVVKTNAEGKATVETVAKQYIGNEYFVRVTAGLLTAVDNQVRLFIDGTATASITTRVEKRVETAPGVYAWVTPSYVTAGDVIRVQATVIDTYGVGRVANTDLQISSEEAIFVSTGTTLAKGQALTLDPWTNNGGGSYTSDEMTVGKAGLVSFSVKDANAASEVSRETSVLVYAGEVAGVKVVEAESNTVKVTQNSVSPAFTLKLTDLYGNEVATNANVGVTVTVAGTEASKVVQLGTSASTLGVASTLSTRGTSTFYVGVTDLDKTGTPASIEFRLGTTLVYTLNLVGK